MNFLKYTFDKITKKFTAPENWGEVPFYKFVKYKQLTEKGGLIDNTILYELFLEGTKKEDWKKAHSPSLYESINDQLSFTSLEPTGEVVTDIYRGLTKKNYKVYSKIEDCTAAEYWDMQEVVKHILQNKSTDAEIVEAMPKLIAVLCLKERTEEKINDVARELEQMPTDKIYVLGCFFLQKLTDLKNGTKKIYQFIKLITHTLKVVSASFLIILVIILHLITFQKGSLASAKQFLSLTWLKFICKYKSTLILKTVKLSTEN